MTELLKSGSELRDKAKEFDSYSVHKGISIAFCSAAIASMVPVVLVQLNIVKKLPELPGDFFDSNRIVKSKAAHPLGIPDALLGLGSYSVTLLLLTAATPSRPLVRGVLRAKLLLDGTVAARKARGQVKQLGRVCSWCLGTALATAGMVYFARKARESQRKQRAHGL